jgi:hypothetical protein
MAGLDESAAQVAPIADKRLNETGLMVALPT